MTSPRLPEQRRPMPVEINLVPRAKAKGERRRTSISISTFNVVLVMLVLALGYLIFPFASFSEDNAIHDLPNLYALYDEHQDAVDGWDKQVDDLKDLLTVATGLRVQRDQLVKMVSDINQSSAALSASTVAWSQVLAEIHDVAPAGIAITSIQQGSDLKIDGEAEASADVYLFRTALLNTQWFSSADVRQVECEPAPCTFTIAATLRGGAL